MAECEPPAKLSRSANTKGVQCFAINCHSYRNQKSREQGITFHKFPDKEKRKDVYMEWVRNCRRDVEPSPHARICSNHFDSSHFIRTLQRTQLKEHAVPTIFDLPDHLKHKSPAKRLSSTSIKALLPLDIGQATTSASLQENIPKEHSYVTHEEDMKKKVLELEKEKSRLQKDVKNAKAREKRAKAVCRSLLEYLTEKNLMNSDLELKLNAYKAGCS